MAITRRKQELNENCIHHPKSNFIWIETQTNKKEEKLTICLGNDEACRITLEHPSPLQQTQISAQLISERLHPQKK